MSKQLWSIGRLLGLYCCLLLLCCGCVQYRMELSFNWLTGGVIVQNLKWDSNVGNFIGNYSESVADELLEEIERRAAAAGGTAGYVSDSEMRVEIPFDNYTQLEEKFNSFFNQPLLLLSQLKGEDTLATGQVPPSEQLSPEFRSTTTLPVRDAAIAPQRLKISYADLLLRDSSIASAVSQPQHNLLAQSDADGEFKIVKHGFGIADRYDLTYTLDLTELRLPVSGSFFSLSADRLLDLQMALTTPIPVSRSNATVRNGNRLEWHLNTGAVNHLFVSMWTPSPIGIVLIVVVALTAFLWAWRLDRHRRRR